MKVYITDCDHDSMSIEKDVFSNSGVDIEILNVKKAEDVISQCHDAEVLLTQYADISEKVLNSLKKLKAVIRYGVGYNNIDVVAATKLGIIVCNVPDYGTNEVADHALTLLLMLSRKVVQVNNDMKKGIWNYEVAIPIFRLQEQVAGIIGLGRIGLSLAKKLNAIGLTIIGFDPFKKHNDLPDYIKLVSFEELLKQSDLISINSPLLKETNHLINEYAFSIMKSNCFIVNTARGGIIDENALLNALIDKKIAGAALDVFEKEPAKLDSKLLALDNFIATPHIAWYSEQAQRDLKRKAAQEALSLARGNKPQYQVNA